MYTHRTRDSFQATMGFDVNLWAVLDALPDCIAVVDGDGIIQYVNSAWYTLILERAVGSFEFTVGNHFLTSFRTAFGAGGVNVVGIEQGLQAILYGESDHIVVSYPYRVGNTHYCFKTTMVPVYLYSGQRGVLIRQVDSSDTQRSSEFL